MDSFSRNLECFHNEVQFDLDKQAVNVVNKVFPGRIRMILEPELINKITGVDLKFNSFSEEKTQNDHQQLLSNDFTGVGKYKIKE